MGYRHVDNLYKNQEILMLKECYAMEKIHGTSAHIGFKKVYKQPEEKEYRIEIKYFSGGEKYEKFVALFDEPKLIEDFHKLGLEEIIIYGEAYGGKCQGMSKMYGKELKFIAFEVKVEHNWLSVPQANEIVSSLGLDFVSYKRIPTTLEAIDKERDMDSVQAIKNGMGAGHKREGVVLRPLIELKKNNGERLVAKHKTEEFRETKSKREITDPAKLKVIEEANAIAEEWVTPMRLNNVLDKIHKPAMEKMREIIKAMIEDIQREGDKEIVWSQAVGKSVGKKTALMIKEYFKDRLVKLHKKEV